MPVNYATARAVRDRIMADYRVAVRIIHTDPADPDSYNVEVKDARQLTENPLDGQLPAGFQKGRWHELSVNTQTNFFYPDL